MPTRMHLSGVDELLDELARLTPELTADTVTLQQRTTAETAGELRGAYAVVTGQMRGSVRVRRDTSISSARVFSSVEVMAPYAHFYEFGTANTEPHPTFVPITRRGREAFTAAVVERVKAAGLVVGGDLR